MPDRSADIAIAKRLGWTDIRPELRRGKPTGEYEGRCDNQLERLPNFVEILKAEPMSLEQFMWRTLTELQPAQCGLIDGL